MHLNKGVNPGTLTNISENQQGTGHFNRGYVHIKQMRLTTSQYGSEPPLCLQMRGLQVSIPLSLWHHGMSYPEVFQVPPYAYALFYVVAISQPVCLERASEIKDCDCMGKANLVYQHVLKHPT